MGHDLHPDPELGQARRLRRSHAKGDVIEEMAPAWIQLPTMSRDEIRCFVSISALPVVVDEVGDEISLSEADFRLLSGAFLAEIEAKCR
jgi:hypothetical protein